MKALLGLLFALASVNVAADTSSMDGGDTAWIMTATALVLFMTLPGLSLFYGGFVVRVIACAAALVAAV